MAAKLQHSESPQQFRERLELPYNRIGWAFEERPDLDSSASFVLLALAFKARENGTSTLAVETVCRLTRLSRPTVRAALKRLVLAGLIVATGKSPGRWTNKYRLALAPYDLKMPTPGERGPTPKRFPRTGKRAEVRTIEPESSLPRKNRRLSKAKKESPPPSIQAQQRPASASAPAAPANGAPAPPSVRTNGNHPSRGRHVMDDFDEAFERDCSRRADEEARPPKPESPKPDPGEVTAAARRLSEEVTKSCGRPLDGAWARYPDLAHELRKRDRREVVRVLSNVLEGERGLGSTRAGRVLYLLRAAAGRVEGRAEAPERTAERNTTEGGMTRREWLTPAAHRKLALRERKRIAELRDRLRGPLTAQERDLTARELTRLEGELAKSLATG